MEEKNENRNFWKIWIRYALLAFMVVAGSILLFFMIFRIDSLKSAIGGFLTILQPIIIGVSLAYLLNPVMNYFEELFLKFFQPRMKKNPGKLCRALSMFVVYILLFTGFFILGNMIIPELYKNIVNLANTLPGQLTDLSDKIISMMNENSNLSNVINTLLEKGTDYFNTWLKTDLLSQANKMMSSVTIGVIGVFKLLLNVFIGLIISIYLLMGKETFVGQLKKATYAVLPAKKANVFLEVMRKSNEIFIGFLSGKIVDSIIIGIICFIVMSIMKLPYIVLVSVIVGITNIIPFFGPYIGAVPSIILITLVNPIQGLSFLIMIIVLQQIDGNIIGPHILGDSTGLSPFWIVFSILVGGGIFGFLGMLLGVPAFAVIYYLIQRILAYFLKKKELPVPSMDYLKVEYIDEDTKKATYLKKENPENDEALKDKKE
ncbi:Predicted PurR-regulated permease PerM [Acetitomaculum ruminis DSM 5522]|uniref:Predicted PurR-regulated permease PerM n=1 Tax=Acetitomaculum ruminis DSM 5522 TaxID=1120918 RepID=A0A1I0W6R2_9FIRM|nr:AI-2E family transporter [Acetitomaculum ruminis]SFA83998.1 Predicted PurR-regulated permease PerM [Acetitomaculum ruminis DSM 5522]